MSPATGHASHHCLLLVISCGARPPSPTLNPRDKIGSTDDQPLQHRVSMISFCFNFGLRTRRSTAPLFGCYPTGLFAVRVSFVWMTFTTSANTEIDISKSVFRNVSDVEFVPALHSSSGGQFRLFLCVHPRKEKSFARFIPDHQNKRLSLCPSFRCGLFHATPLAPT